MNPDYFFIYLIDVQREGQIMPTPEERKRHLELLIRFLWVVQKPLDERSTIHRDYFEQKNSLSRFTIRAVEDFQGFLDIQTKDIENPFRSLFNIQRPYFTDAESLSTFDSPMNFALDLELIASHPWQLVLLNYIYEHYYVLLAKKNRQKFIDYGKKLLSAIGMNPNDEVAALNLVLSISWMKKRSEEYAFKEILRKLIGTEGRYYKRRNFSNITDSRSYGKPISLTRNQPYSFSIGTADEKQLQFDLAKAPDELNRIIFDIDLISFFEEIGVTPQFLIDLRSF